MGVNDSFIGILHDAVLLHLARCPTIATRSVERGDSSRRGAPHFGGVGLAIGLTLPRRRIERETSTSVVPVTHGYAEVLARVAPETKESSGESGKNSGLSIQSVAQYLSRADCSSP